MRKRRKALERESGAWSRRSSKQASSMHLEKFFFCWRSTLMSSIDNHEDWLTEWAKSATAPRVERGVGGGQPLISATKGRVKLIDLDHRVNWGAWPSSKPNQKRTARDRRPHQRVKLSSTLRTTEGGQVRREKLNLWNARHERSRDVAIWQHPTSPHSF